jgi:hypothetical protein
MVVTAFAVGEEVVSRQLELPCCLACRAAAVKAMAKATLEAKACSLARAADPAGEGNRSDAEAWRRRTI